MHGASMRQLLVLGHPWPSWKSLGFCMSTATLATLHSASAAVHSDARLTDEFSCIAAPTVWRSYEMQDDGVALECLTIASPARSAAYCMSDDSQLCVVVPVKFLHALLGSMHSLFVFPLPPTLSKYWCVIYFVPFRGFEIVPVDLTVSISYCFLEILSLATSHSARFLKGVHQRRAVTDELVSKATYCSRGKPMTGTCMAIEGASK